MIPEIGTNAPAFTVSVVGDGYDEGNTVSLTELKGHKVVLIFYPKDSTPG